MGDIPFNSHDFGYHIDWPLLMKNLVKILSISLDLNNNNKYSKDNKNEEENKDNRNVLNNNNKCKNYKEIINMKYVLSFRLHSLSSIVLNSLLLDSNILSSYIREFQNESLSILTKFAFEKCHISCEVPTNVLQDRNHILMMECLQRSRLSKEVDIELVHDNGLQIIVKEPKIKFVAEFVNIGKHLKKQTQQKAH